MTEILVLEVRLDRKESQLGEMQVYMRVHMRERKNAGTKDERL